METPRAKFSASVSTRAEPSTGSKPSIIFFGYLGWRYVADSLSEPVPDSGTPYCGLGRPAPEGADIWQPIACEGVGWRGIAYCR